MSKVVVYEVDVMFGDCDPAGIVFFPNFSKWMDTASLNVVMACGVPPWRELAKTRGITLSCSCMKKRAYSRACLANGPCCAATPPAPKCSA